MEVDFVNRICRETVSMLWHWQKNDKSKDVEKGIRINLLRDGTG
jgi:hypothetical protein